MGDPHCPAICDPVCEPPKCHTSCAEPKNAICDVKCEKPECEIKCPDKGCEMFDCPKCVTVCKQPHCVTHCQAPKPNARLSVKNPSVTGNAISLNFLNLNVSSYVKTLIAHQKLSAALVQLGLQKLTLPSPSLKKPNKIKNV